jgi:hypothetical protein
MHTDEYEISIGREISLCRKMIRKLEKSLGKLERQYGMTTAAFLRALEEGRLSARLPIQRWNLEYRELQLWQKRLTAYEDGLESLKRTWGR